MDDTPYRAAATSLSGTVPSTARGKMLVTRLGMDT